MSGANYAYCDHCNTKAFYDAETDIGDAAVFHGKCLPEHDAEVAAKAWNEGHAAGRDYQADGWNSAVHDPAEDNPYRREAGESDADA